MSRLHIYPENGPDQCLLESEQAQVISQQLKEVGVRFEQWSVHSDIQIGATPEQVIAAYQQDIDRLVQEAGYQSFDVISLSSDHPEKAALREKFLSEHRHQEDEVRFFVAGEGLFSLHIKDQVYEVLCCQGDLISVPANTPHWFDMGPNPNFIAIRLFNNPDGWIAHYTENEIADRFPRLEN